MFRAEHPLKTRDRSVAAASCRVAVDPKEPVADFLVTDGSTLEAVARRTRRANQSLGTGVIVFLVQIDTVGEVIPF